MPFSSKIGTRTLYLVICFVLLYVLRYTFVSLYVLYLYVLFLYVL